MLEVHQMRVAPVEGDLQTQVEVDQEGEGLLRVVDQVEVDPQMVQKEVPVLRMEVVVVQL